MITKSELADAARYTDALTEEYGLQETMRRQGIDLAGVMYIAEERALRAAMIFDSQDPTELSRTETTQVQLSPTGTRGDGDPAGRRARRRRHWDHRQAGAVSDLPTDTTDPRVWHAYIAGAHTFTEAAERIEEAIRHGVDFQALRRAHREARS